MKSSKNWWRRQTVAHRNPGGMIGKVIAGIALFWAAFQLWIASPLPYTAIGRIIPVLNDTQTRSLHLAIAVFLAFMAYPAFKSSSRTRIPIIDWVLGITGALCAGLLFTPTKRWRRLVRKAFPQLISW